MGEQQGRAKKLSHLNGGVLTSLYCTRREEQVKHDMGNMTGGGGDEVELVGPKERVEEEWSGVNSRK